MIYVDTSALAKRYLNEKHSEEFEAFLGAESEVIISTLAILEMRCLVARRRRSREIDEEITADILLAFKRDRETGIFSIQRLADAHVQQAVSLMDQVAGHPLRTLDALHLACATASKIRRIATSDRVMAAAAAKLDIEVVAFI